MILIERERERINEKKVCDYIFIGSSILFYNIYALFFVYVNLLK